MGRQGAVVIKQVQGVAHILLCPVVHYRQTDRGKEVFVRPFQGAFFVFDSIGVDPEFER